MSTPFLLSHGASQYADIVTCCFMTAAVLVYCIYDWEPVHAGLPLLAGGMAVAAACTKNEGILFFILLVLARVVVAAGRRAINSLWLELLAFAGGASLGLLTLVIFKQWYSPPNDTVPVMAAHDVFARITDASLNLHILRGIRKSLNFGQWLMNPIPLIAIHTALTWSNAKASNRRWNVPWFTPAFVIVGMFCGVYLVYLLSPYDVESHLESSLDRVLLQLWPSIVVLYCMIVAPPGSTVSAWTLSPVRSIRRVAIIAVLIASIVAWSPAEPPPGMTAGSRPHIELSRSEAVPGETYRMKITGVGPQVYVSYSLNDKPMGQFGAYLGTDGSVDFQVSGSTWKGTYRFLAVRPGDSSVWIAFDQTAAITVK